MNQQDFAQWVGYLAQRAPSFEQHMRAYPQLQHGWSMDLADFTLDEACKGLDRLVADPKLLPPVEERDFLPLFLIKAIRELRAVQQAAAQREEQQKAAEARMWQKGAWEYATTGSCGLVYELLCRARRKWRNDGLADRDIDKAAHKLCQALFPIADGEAAEVAQWRKELYSQGLDGNAVEKEMRQRIHRRAEEVAAEHAGGPLPIINFARQGQFTRRH